MSALISSAVAPQRSTSSGSPRISARLARSEEHTSELQSPDHLVCRVLLEKKDKNAGYCCRPFLHANANRLGDANSLPVLDLQQHRDDLISYQPGRREQIRCQLDHNTTTCP